MIGTWRWFLALLVVVGHLYGAWWPASYAVFSFYIISGFLMTLIMNEHYSFTSTGIRAFWANRFLRLYPPYYLACLFSLTLIWWIPSEYIVTINSKIILPQSIFEFITNIIIVGLQANPNNSSLVPPAWALSIELFYYCIISLWAGKSKLNAFLFLFLGIVYLLIIYLFKDFNWFYRYFLVGAGALPFAVGVNLYFYRKNLQKWFASFSRGNILLLSLALYVLVFIVAFNTNNKTGFLFYLNILTTAFLLIVLWYTPQNRLLKKIDSFMGDLSYPTYLLHWQAGILVAYISGFTFKGWEVFLIATLIVTAVAFIEAKTISGSIEKFRKRIKKNANEPVLSERNRVREGI